MNDEKNVHSDVNRILAQYRSMPHRTTGKSPAELFLGRKMRCKLDLLKPSEKVMDKVSVNKHLKAKLFNLNQRVIARNYSGKQKWVLGKICKIKGKLHYEIQLDDGRLWMRHADQIESASSVRVDGCKGNLGYYVPDSEQLLLKNPEIVVPSNNTDESSAVRTDQEVVVESTAESSTNAAISDRPKRNVKPPERYGYVPQVL